MPSCRAEDGGVPQCKLGGLGCRHVEIRGTDLPSVANSFRRDLKSLSSYRVMIIGDYPTWEDDIKGIPFQGDFHHKTLDWIEESGLNEAEVYVTYLAKCKPPRKRKVSGSEYRKCKDTHLVEEIKAVRPEVIILVGASTKMVFNLQGNLNDLRGQVFEKKLPGWDDGPTFKVIPTINPITLRYKDNRKLEARLKADYRLAADVLRGEEFAGMYIPNWQLIDSFEKLDEIIAHVKETKLIGFDTESPSLGFKKWPMMCTSLAWDHQNACGVIPWFSHDPDAEGLKLKPAWGLMNHEKVVSKLKEIFEDPTIAKAAHNIKYDLNVYRHYLGININGFLWDTQVMHHLIDENPPHALEFLLECEFQYGYYSRKVKEITGLGSDLTNTYDHVPDEILWPYASTDAEGTFRLVFTYYQELAKKPHLLKLYNEKSEPAMQALGEGEYHGTLVDSPVAQTLLAESNAKLNECLTKIRSYTNPEFNPNSPFQVWDAFIKLGYEDHITDPAQASGYRADKNKLQEIQDDCQLAADLLEHRSITKEQGTYIRPCIEEVDDDGRLRYQFNQHRTVTGRLSCSRLHQIPKIDEARYEAKLPVLRSIFKAPEGWDYFYGDYSQVELRILAIISKDLELQRVFREDLDLHAITTAEVLSSVMPNVTEENIPHRKFNRSEVGKRINFGIAYGSQGHSLLKTGKWMDEQGRVRNFTKAMLDEGMERFHARFQGVGDYIKNTPDMVRANGCVAINVFGRERRFGDILLDDNEYIRGEAERQLINYYIQSAAGEVTVQTLTLIYYKIKELVEGGELKYEFAPKLVNTVHDSIAYEVHKNYTSWFTEVFKTIALRPIPELEGQSFPIGFGVGPNWTEAEWAA